MYSYSNFGTGDKLAQIADKFRRNVKNTVLQKGIDIGKKQLLELAEAAKKPDSYRRGAISSIMGKLNPKQNQLLNETILDLDDLAQNGNKKITRRDFLSKAVSRTTRRLNPIKDPTTHDTVEQIKDTIDSLSPPKKKPPETKLGYSYMGQANFSTLLPTLAQAGAGGLLYGGAYVGSKKLMGENLSDEQTRRELIANTAGATASGVGGVLLLKALMNKGVT